MSLLRKWGYSSIILCFLLSCNKYIVDDYPEESSCDRFAGKYSMYNSENDASYEMVISCNPYTGKINTNSLDSVMFYNFANLFEFGHNVGSNKEIAGTIIQPLSDKNGNRWTFSNSYGADLENRINVLVGDSIYLYFNIDNTAYWIDDGGPYQSITSVHSGVKIH